jgi:hypothetical protein
MARPGQSGEEREQFFFEKETQKTFTYLGPLSPGAAFTRLSLWRGRRVLPHKANMYVLIA